MKTRPWGCPWIFARPRHATCRSNYVPPWKIPATGGRYGSYRKTPRVASCWYRGKSSNPMVRSWCCVSGQQMRAVTNGLTAPMKKKSGKGSTRPAACLEIRPPGRCSMHSTTPLPMTLPSSAAPCLQETSAPSGRSRNCALRLTCHPRPLPVICKSMKKDATQSCTCRLPMTRCTNGCSPYASGIFSSLIR